MELLDLPLLPQLLSKEPLLPQLLSREPLLPQQLLPPAIAQVNTIAAPVAQVQAAVPSVTSSQFHAQDEDKNFSFGYSNINSARQESGNALTGVVGSYSNGHN